MALRRYYIETSDVSGATEAQVALAEELIDRYVGPQNKYLHSEYHGVITSLTNAGKTITDDSTTNGTTQLDQISGHFKNAVLEMISGAQAGKRKVIESSSRTGKSVTLREAFSSNPAVGDYFKIYQLAKFPRAGKDTYSTPDGLNVYPSIPEVVREAVVAQVEYIMAKGAAYFTGDVSEMQSESFLNYSYTRGGDGTGGNSLTNLISPQARSLLRGIVNRTGRIVEGPGYERRHFI